MSIDHFPEPNQLIVEAFTVATQTAFEELAQTHVIPGVASFGEPVSHPDDVVAEIQLKRALRGRLLIAFRRSALTALAVRYLPTGEALSEEIENDVAGEFANVIAGQAKTILKGTPFHFSISTPRVGDWNMMKANEANWLKIPFDVDSGSLSLFLILPPE